MPTAAITRHGASARRVSPAPGVVAHLYLSRRRRGKALVLCHGASSDKENLAALARAMLAHGYTVLVPDFHGHGESEGERAHVDLAAWQRDLRACVQFLRSAKGGKAKRVGAIGFSSGGTVILEALAGVAGMTGASIANADIDCAATLAATVRPIAGRLETGLLRGVAKAGAWTQRLLGRELRLPLYPVAMLTPLACDPTVNRQLLDAPAFREAYFSYPFPGGLASFDVDTLTRVSRIRVPVCVLHGAQDKVDDPESARCLYRRLHAPKAIHILPSSGHFLHIDVKKREIERILAQWFERWL